MKRSNLHVNVCAAVDLFLASKHEHVVTPPPFPAILILIAVRPSLRLPRVPCYNFVCDFPYGFGDIVCGYGLYGACVYKMHDYRAMFCADSWGTDRDKSARRLRGHCTTIVQFQCSYRTVSASFLWDRTESVWRPCIGCTEIWLR